MRRSPVWFYAGVAGFWIGAVMILHAIAENDMVLTVAAAALMAAAGTTAIRNKPRR